MYLKWSINDPPQKKTILELIAKLKEIHKNKCIANNEIWSSNYKKSPNLGQLLFMLTTHVKRNNGSRMISHGIYHDLKFF